MRRFSDAGNHDVTMRAGDRRLKSAKARNRGGRWCGAVPRALWGFGRGVKVEEVGAERERRSVAGNVGVKTRQSRGRLDGGRPDWQRSEL